MRIKKDAAPDKGAASVKVISLTESLNINFMYTYIFAHAKILIQEKRFHRTEKAHANIKLMFSNSILPPYNENFNPFLKIFFDFAFFCGLKAFYYR